MKFNVSTVNEIIATFKDGEDEARIVFRAPTAPEILITQMSQGQAQMNAMMYLLKSTFLRFEGTFQFLNEKGEEVIVKDFAQITALNGVGVFGIINTCLESLAQYIEGLSELEKK